MSLLPAESGVMKTQLVPQRNREPPSERVGTKGACRARVEIIEPISAPIHPGWLSKARCARSPSCVRGPGSSVAYRPSTRPPRASPSGRLDADIDSLISVRALPARLLKMAHWEHRPEPRWKDFRFNQPYAKGLKRLKEEVLAKTDFDPATLW